MAKITIDWTNSIFDINSSEVVLDVKSEIYSEWKRQIQLSDNSKWPQAMTSVGGEDLPGGKFVPSFFFMLNGWKVRSWTGSGTINIGTNLFSDDGSSPFISGGSRASIVAETTTGVTVSGGVTISASDLLAISNAVWNAQTTDNNNSGTFGRKVQGIRIKAGSLII